MVERFDFLLPIAILFLLLSSCDREQEFNLARHQAISFSVSNSISVSTKASGKKEEKVEELENGGGMLLCTTCEEMPVALPATKGTPFRREADITDLKLGVLAYTYDTDGAPASAKQLYSAPLPVSYDSESKEWLPDTPLYWPRADKYIQFYAYAPYDDQESSVIDNNGTPVITYTIPSDVSSQNGLLVADPVQRGDNPERDYEEVVSLSFRHVLSGVRFKIDEEFEIQSVTLKGIYDNGSYNMTTGRWSIDESDPSIQEYTLSSSENDYTEDGFKVMDQCFMLIPQTLTSVAILTVTVGGEDFVVNLEGKELPAGKLTTFSFTYGAEFKATDPTDIDWFDGNSQTATVTSYVKRSDTEFRAEPWEFEGCYDSEDAAKSGNGPAIESPWGTIVSSTDSYDGGRTPATVGIEFSRVSPLPTPADAKPVNNLMNVALSLAPPKGQSDSYWNLANPIGNGTHSAGGDFIVESANCYIVNAPGYYRIPLVVGNGVKQGSPNISAYSEQSNFTDYKGNTISSPYLHKTAGLDNEGNAMGGVGTPTKAFIIWEDQNGLIDDVKEDDNHTYVLPSNAISTTGSKDEGNLVYWLNFHIDKDNIKQGNAVIAVTDGIGEANGGLGDIMWSWHIWITTYVPGNYRTTGDANINSNDDADLYPDDVVIYPEQGDGPTPGTMDYYTIMPFTLGWVEIENRHWQFSPRTIYARLVQKNTGKVAVMTIRDPGADLPAYASGHCPYFQWGRKDALQPSDGMSDIGKVDGKAHVGKSYDCFGKYVNNGNYKPFNDDGHPTTTTLSTMIQHPWIWYKASVVLSNPDYKNWWCAGNTDNTYTNTKKKVVKTIYDPCPAGYHVAEAAAFTGFNTDNSGAFGTYDAAGDIMRGWCFLTHSANSAKYVFFPALGDIWDGYYYSVTYQGYSWLAFPGSQGGNLRAFYMGYSNGGYYPHNDKSGGYYRNGALAIRPVRDY